jgi:hypothetical protein
MFFKEGNEFATFTMTREELDKFLNRAQDKCVSYEKFWMDIITDNGKHPTDEFTCISSQDDNYICDMKCEHCHVKNF